MKLTPIEEEIKKRNQNIISIPNALLPDTFSIPCLNNDPSNLKFAKEIVSNVVINLYENVKSYHMSYHLPLKKTQGISSELFDRNGLRSMIIALSKKYNVTISNNAIQFIVKKISSTFIKVVLIASQNSLKRVNHYVDLPNREIHLNPMITINYNFLEMVALNKIYEKSYNQQGDYKPFFINFPQVKTIGFPQDSSEGYQQKLQLTKIFQTLEYNIKNKMNNTNKDELLKCIEYVQALLKKNSVNTENPYLQNNSSNIPPNINSNNTGNFYHVFCSEKNEENRKLHRAIKAKDVLYSLKFFPKAIQQLEPELRLSIYK